MRPIAFLSLTSLLLASCEPGRSVEDEPRELVRGDNASLQGKVDGVMADLSRLRGLPTREPVIARWVDRTHLMSLLDSIDGSFVHRPDTGVGPHPTKAEIYGALGYLTAEQVKSLEEEERSFDSSAIDGFYVPNTGKFWLVNDPGTPLAYLDQVVAHELSHALQDQNFWDTARAQTMDAMEARQFLIEGEAEYMGELWSLRDLTGQRFPQEVERIDLPGLASRVKELMPKSPMVTVLPVYSVYSLGKWSIHDQRMARGWAAIDQLHKKAPTSTHRMLHPLNQEFDLLATAWPEVELGSHEGLVSLGSDQLGEVYLHTLLTQRNASNRWDPASWRGDRFWLWREADSLHHLGGGRVRLATESDAQALLLDWMGQTSTLRIPLADDKDSAILQDSPGLVRRGVRQGRDLYLLWGDRSERWGDALMDSVWRDLVALQPEAQLAGRGAGRRPTTGGSFRGIPDQPRIWKFTRGRCGS